MSKKKSIAKKLGLQLVISVFIVGLTALGAFHHACAQKPAAHSLPVAARSMALAPIRIIFSPVSALDLSITPPSGIQTAIVGTVTSIGETIMPGAASEMPTSTPQPATSTPTPSVEATKTPVPTFTTVATMTSVPTLTTKPTSTPTATFTAQPTSTPSPTFTAQPVPPTEASTGQTSAPVLPLTGILLTYWWWIAGGLLALVFLAVAVLLFRRRKRFEAGARGQRVTEPLSPQPPPPITTPSLRPEPTPGRPYLQNAVDPTLWFSLENDVAHVGRAPANDVGINENYQGWETVSEHHARLEWDAERQRWLVIDEGSLNGVFVHGQRTGENVLRAGEHVRFGQVEFVFQMQG
jgi:hypothetical protein